MDDESNFIDAINLPLDEWLKYVLQPSSDVSIVDYEFPTDKHFDEFIATIDKRSDNEIRKILMKFLIPSGTLGIDKLRLAGFVAARQNDPEMFRRMTGLQFYRRLFLYATKRSSCPPWEGITWIIDLLPVFPKQALEGLNAYSLAHIQQLPDGRINGLFEAAEIIRAKYIGLPKNQGEKIKLLMELSSREFEHIVERLYSEMDYETQLTPAQKDGGRDIIAKKNRVGNLEHLLVECKQYSKPVDIKIVRALMGVVSDEKVNKGVLVTTSRFTKGAIDFADRNPRLELISGNNLIPLLNEHFGARWPVQIERIIADSQKDNSQ